MELLLVSGPPGVGKSTLCAQLARRFGWVHLDKDAIDEPFSPEDRGDHYTREVEPKSLEALLGLAALNLRNGNSVILDAPWSHILLNTPQWVTRILDLARGSRARLRVLEMTLPPEQLKRRIRERGWARDRSKLSETGWAEFLQRDRVGELVPLEHHLVRADEASDEVLAQAVRFLV